MQEVETYCAGGGRSVVKLLVGNKQDKVLVFTHAAYSGLIFYGI
jgi:hypothetical protein